MIKVDVFYPSKAKGEGMTFAPPQMKLLLVTWTGVRVGLEAAVWATAFWCVSDSFFDIQWLHFYWVFLVILFLDGLSVIKASPGMAGRFLSKDLMLVGLAILQGCSRR
jgi:hypothetical protein